MKVEFLDFARQTMYDALAGLNCKMALYDGEPPKAYTMKGEVKATGYLVGGKAVKFEGEGCLSCPDVVWPDSDITASGALIYDAKTGKGLLRATFPNKTSFRDDFTVSVAGDALVEIV